MSLVSVSHSSHRRRRSDRYGVAKEEVLKNTREGFALPTNIWMRNKVFKTWFMGRWSGAGHNLLIAEGPWGGSEITDEGGRKEDQIIPGNIAATTCLKGCKNKEEQGKKDIICTCKATIFSKR